MIIPGVQCTDGSPLDLPIEESKLIGYQIEHIITSRRLPGTTSFQVFGGIMASLKLTEICEVYELDSAEYEIVPVYDVDLDGAYIMIEHPLDTFLKNI